MRIRTKSELDESVQYFAQMEAKEPNGARRGMLAILDTLKVSQTEAGVHVLVSHHVASGEVYTLHQFLDESSAIEFSENLQRDISRLTSELSSGNPDFPGEYMDTVGPRRSGICQTLHYIRGITLSAHHNVFPVI